MRSLPTGSRTARRRPRPGLPRALLPAVVAACAAVTAAGCAAQAGVRDDGAAPSLSAPASAVPLWPRYTPSAVTTPREKPDFARYLPVDKVKVPSGGLAALSAKNLLLHDPNVPAVVQKEVSLCPDGGYCPLRDTVHRDLTGDGRDELVVAADLPAFERTLLQVYTAPGRTVRPVLIYWGPPGLTGETFGRDLLISAIGGDGRVTTRFRWNGTVMAAVTPEDGTATRTPLPDGAATGPPVPGEGAAARTADPGAAPEAVPSSTGAAADTGTRTETRTTR
ncbi:hypothetical protein [Streptomyces rapamycinicus]|uniref:Lipoprotein n=2 Tax=Streptomyces rapamycinicus TaxID=1226757 RepID=A0A0A0N3W1_STRRN|nr:hypothetical protein [Streptomyces rapamycinicus]AGP52867.1 hypothetical protein M271_06205 [Streptomyces rapamycinicus NRRL 5491]MBB4780345.1 hypothetical protein [Streptomyces rapamycinicus]RLV75000.1 hypothetical protein D3C57_137280 [Streptomyces rapamycinicus NRRL 5491]UTO61078.1 hypothetical protein LJB45_01255 [Streptomyces rapamycinicus]UTP29022.1 hypothetical protein LIV37_06375 [Streptomyces rapamycinicus NRRL 5491]